MIDAEIKSGGVAFSREKKATFKYKYILSAVKVCLISFLFDHHEIVSLWVPQIQQALHILVVVEVVCLCCINSYREIYYNYIVCQPKYD